MLAFVPIVSRRWIRRTGGTDSARYCYSVWLRHLVMAQQQGLNSRPQTVAELGPGDSLGIGLAALISGSERYYALDAIPHANTISNLRIFDELVELFRVKEPIPAEDEFPEVKPKLDAYDFPRDILDDDRLQRALNGQRLDRIRTSLLNTGGEESVVQYIAPWNDPSRIHEGTVDMIFLKRCSSMLMTFPAHIRLCISGSNPRGLCRTRSISDAITRQMNGMDIGPIPIRYGGLSRGRPFLLNRAPHSTHRALLNIHGFKVIFDRPVPMTSNLSLNDVAPRFRQMTEADLTTSGAFIQAVRDR